MATELRGGTLAVTKYEDPGITYQEAVAAGIAALDAADEVPDNWREIINWNTLEIDNPWKCLLTQIFYVEAPGVLGWNEVYHKFLVFHPEIDENISAFGFAWDKDPIINDEWRRQAGVL